MKILITGATGFLGGATAAELIRDGLGPKLQLLARADTPEAGLARVKDSLHRFELTEGQLDALVPGQVIPGDFSDVGAFANHPLLDETTHVVNCAAVASFSDHPDIWPVNVTGTFEFAKRMSRAPRLQRFLHVGTAMACGPKKTSPIQESWTLPALEEHLVRYTASKAEIERMMHEQLPALPLVVARPSIVVGHTRLGCAPSSSIFWVFRMVHDLGCFLFSVDDQIDVIPVDYCATALKFLLLREHLAHDLYHVSAGSRSGESFRQIDQELARARGIAPVGDSYRQITEAEIPSLLPRFQEKLGIRNRRLLSLATKLYGNFSSLSYIFDNTRLIEEGMPPPPRFTSYIAECVRSTEGKSLLEQMYDDFK